MKGMLSFGMVVPDTVCSETQVWGLTTRAQEGVQWLRHPAMALDIFQEQSEEQNNALAATLSLSSTLLTRLSSTMDPDLLPQDEQEFEELLKLLEGYEGGQKQGFGPLPEDLQVWC
jgi:hypothetical protein